MSNALASPGHGPIDPRRVYAIVRPHSHLLLQFLILALFTAAAFPVTALILYFRYQTLRYRFDDRGVSVSYGILFRREAFLTYARIQDIHLKRNIIERWLGIGTIEIETAAGSGAGKEVIQGLTEFELVRDFLYSRMRGAHPLAAPSVAKAETGAETLLVEIRDALRDARAAVEEGRRS
jgi:putative membrane protein